MVRDDEELDRNGIARRNLIRRKLSSRFRLSKEEMQVALRELRERNYIIINKRKIKIL